ncbi:MAG: DedA family protein [Vicinamibacteria bacterium]|nr:DedA family protein [Vicinamibacteria bacterium]
MTDRLLDWLASLPTAYSYAALMALSAIENVFPPVPADVAVALGAFLSQRLGRSVVTLGVLCWGANASTAIGMYVLARRYGVEFFRSGWRRKAMPAEAMTALETVYARYGIWGIFLSRFLPGVRAAVTPFAGVVGMPARTALIPAVSASAIWYAAIVGAATAFGFEWQSIRRLIENVNGVLGLVAIGFAIAGVLWLIIRVRRARGARNESGSDGEPRNIT